MIFIESLKAGDSVVSLFHSSKCFDEGGSILKDSIRPLS